MEIMELTEIVQETCDLEDVSDDMIEDKSTIEAVLKLRV